MPLDDEDMIKIETTFSRYVKIMDENYVAHIKPIVEMQVAQGEKLDGIYEMVAKNTEDITMMKGDLRVIHKDMGIMKGDITNIQSDMKVVKGDINIIKNDLKQKVDRDEFMVLEKRVIRLENKFGRA